MARARSEELNAFKTESTSIGLPQWGHAKLRGWRVTVVGRCSGPGCHANTWVVDVGTMGGLVLGLVGGVQGGQTFGTVFCTNASPGVPGDNSVEMGGDAPPDEGYNAGFDAGWGAAMGSGGGAQGAGAQFSNGFADGYGAASSTLTTTTVTNPDGSTS